MAIRGLTVTNEGEAIQRLAVTTKVAIGEVVKTSTGATHPKKLDHFVFLRKSVRSLEWEPDADLGKHYGSECREFWIVLLNDEAENVFRTEYAWWTKTEKKCWGDGNDATRRTDAHPDGEPWPGNYKAAPCGDGCPDLERGDCKPSGDLYFILADFPRLGSVCRLHTTSYRSIRQIASALEQVRTVTGGRLAGIRCKLVVRPEKTAYFDEAKKKKLSTTIYALNLELSADDMRKLIGEMTQYAQLFQQTRKLLGAPRVQILPDDEEEVERAPDVAQEFYPAAQIAPAPAVAQPTRTSQAPATVPAAVIPAANGNNYITADQRMAFYHVCVEAGWGTQQVKELLLSEFGVKSSSEIPADKYEEISARFKSGQMEVESYKPTDEDIPF